MSHTLMTARHRARRARVTQNSKLRTQNYELTTVSTTNCGGFSIVFFTEH